MVEFAVNYAGTPFLHTSTTTPDLNRLNCRAELLLSRNQDAIEGKRVLDLASHDGRFSYACLALGAAHVTGIEGRENLVKSAHQSMGALGFAEDRFHFEVGDLYGFLARCEPDRFDTILCFGFFYHTIDQVTLLKEVSRLRPSTFILDTTVYPTDGVFMTWLRWANRLDRLARRTVQKLTGKTRLTNHKDFTRELMVFIRESHDQEANTTDSHDVVAIPTKSLVKSLMAIHGMPQRELKMDRGALATTRHVDDYLEGRRAAFRADLSG